MNADQRRWKNEEDEKGFSLTAFICVYLRLFPFLVFVFAVGCDDKRVAVVPVEGRVTVAGEPLRGMVICFVSPSGYAASCPLTGDGTFRLTSQHGEGIPPGEYRVSFSPNVSPQEVRMDSPAPLVPLPIAERYLRVESSGLAYQVVSGGEPLHLDLEP